MEAQESIKIIFYQQKGGDSLKVSYNASRKNKKLLEFEEKTEELDNETKE
ncbi:hypothetical protein J4232_05365 [Candidatus Woesearchaeota archaeon]|nr:hypothetical protein [Candidatus Woesearchaeota archaeon]